MDKSRLYTVKVNEAVFDLDEDRSDTLDMVQSGADGFHLLKGHRSYLIKVLRTEFARKKITLRINKNTYEVQISDAYDRMVEEMGLFESAAQKVNEIYAPMPGLIMDIMVKEGQEISEETPLLVLSAMKMENIILSQGGGKIKSVHVKTGDTVEKGQLIVEME